MKYCCDELEWYFKDGTFNTWRGADGEFDIDYPYHMVGVVSGCKFCPFCGKRFESVRG